MKNFETLLDRHGTDFAEWPAGLADRARRHLLTSPDARRTYRRLVDIERQMAASRPEITPNRVRQVVSRATLAICQDRLRPSMTDRLLALLMAPGPRLAFAMGLTAIGFGIGIVLGTPDNTFSQPQGSPLMTAAADDGVF